VKTRLQGPCHRFFEITTRAIQRDGETRSRLGRTTKFNVRLDRPLKFPQSVGRPPTPLQNILELIPPKIMISDQWSSGRLKIELPEFSGGRGQIGVAQSAVYEPSEARMQGDEPCRPPERRGFLGDFTEPAREMVQALRKLVDPIRTPPTQTSPFRICSPSTRYRIGGSLAE
jgi:hypothetical protein